MTNTEINLKIAETRGISARKMVKYFPAGEVFVSDNNGNKIDYINDPPLILELEMELLNARWMPTFVGNLNMLDMYLWKKGSCSLVDKHFGKATALAWLKMKESEK